MANVVFKADNRQARHKEKKSMDMVEDREDKAGTKLAMNLERLLWGIMESVEPFSCTFLPPQNEEDQPGRPATWNDHSVLVRGLPEVSDQLHQAHEDLQISDLNVWTCGDR